MFRRTRIYPPELREQARELRRAGLTYPEIIAKLGGDIPQATLTGWVKDIVLTTEQRARIKRLEVEGARKAQPFGAMWNRLEKQKRLQAAKAEATPAVQRLVHNREALRLMAAALYVGEGSKRNDAFSFCNSDPNVIRGWMSLLRNSFDLDESKFRCQINISDGMLGQELEPYWSQITKIPLSQFIKSSVDKRPNKKIRDGYKGVCVVVYHSVAIRRYLEALAQGVLDQIADSECNINLGL